MDSDSSGQLPGSGEQPLEIPAQNLLDGLIEGCQIIGRDYRYLYVNKAAATQGRGTKEQLLGRTMMDVYPGIEQTPMFSLLKQCMDERTPQSFENEFAFPDGSSGWFDLRIEPVPQGVFILSLDITDRKRAEEERLRLSTAITHSAEAVIITDRLGVIRYVNPAFERITGFSPADAIGQSPRILNSGRQDKAFYQDMWGTITGGRTWRGRLVNRRKDGTYFTEDATISPVYDAHGEIANFVCVKRDVSTELELEEQFRQSQKLEAIGRLAGGVAHDFNNLLSVIIGSSDVLLQNLAEHDANRNDVIEIRRAGERATNLTKQLLAFSRKQVVQVEHVDVNAVVRGMEELLRRLLGEDIRLRTRLASNLGLVKSNVAQLEQVLLNLAVNSRDAMPRGGSLTIETFNADLDEAYSSRHYGVTPGQHVVVAVTDTGRGMDPDTLARVFEPFFTTKGGQGGSGLGLATVYGIVKQHGGSVFVYSEPGRGTTMKVYLPRDNAERRIVTPRAQASVRTRGDETILLVEDEDAVRRITARLLTNAGYNVLSAGSGKDALDLWRKRSDEIRLVLTDVVMPEMNGVELARRIREMAPQLRVLFASGYAAGAVGGGHFEELDPDAHFIGKPFTAAELARKVREVLDASPREEGRDLPGD